MGQTLTYACRVTPMQENMLYESLSSAAAGEAAAYMSVLRFRARQSINAEDLRRRWENVNRRHRALRTVFRRDGDGIFWQAVRQGTCAGFSCRDLGGYAPGEREAIVLRESARRAETAMVPEKGDLCRLDVFLRSEEGCDLLFAFHHAVLDGWSVNLILAELFSEVAGQSRAPSFDTYVQWLEGRDREADLAWWRTYLADSQPTTPAFPGQVKGHGVALRRCERFVLEESGELSRTAASLGTTRSRLLQAAWAGLVARYNGGKTFVGQIVSGRAGGFGGAADLVGMCVNTLPIKADWARGRRFGDWFAEWNRTLAEAEEHGFCGLADLGRMVEPGVALVPHLAVVDPEAGGNCRLLDGHGRLAADFIAGFTLGERIAVQFDYNARVHSDASVRDIGAHFRSMLRAILRNPHVAMEEIAVPTERERIELLCGGDPDYGERPPGGTEESVVTRWREASARFPDAFALGFGHVSLTYRELERRVDSLAAALAESGVMDESPVAVIMERSERQFIVALAVMVAGGFYIPCDPGWPAERLGEVLADVNPVVILNDDAYDRMASGRASGKILASPRPDQAAYATMTSGSTGKPKGVVIEHRALLSFCLWSCGRYGWKPGDVAAQHASFVFDAAIAMVWPPLMSGAGVWILPESARRDPVELHDFLLRHNATHTDLPVALAEEFMERFAAEAAPPSLRFLTVGGEALRRYAPSGYCVINEYGPTECTVTCAAHTVSETSGTIPIGRPLPGMRAYVLEPDDGLCPTGMFGELCFSGDQLARGYLNRPELTKAKFVANPFFRTGADDPVHARLYRTGDRARWLRRDDGDIVLDIAGRLDGQAKVRGHRIEIGEIEAVLTERPEVLRAAARVRTDSLGGQTLYAYAMARDASVDGKALRAHLAGRLPAYAVPAEVIVLDSFPLAATGKVDYAALPEPASAERPVRTPVGDRETALASLIALLVGAPDVDMGSAFTAVGGDSIRAMRLAARLEKAGWKLSVREIMAAPDLSAMAEAMRPIGAIVNSAPPTTASGPDGDTLARIRGKLGEVEEVYAPTATQRMLLFSHSLAGNAAYAVTTRWRMAWFDAAAFATRLQAVFDRHGILSARFFRDGEGNDWLAVPAKRPARFCLADVSSTVSERNARGIDPYEDALFTVEAVRFSPERHELVIRHHHAVLDGWSLGLILDELFSKEMPGGKAPSFSAYAAWLASGGAAAEKADADWWNAELDGAVPAVALPGRGSHGDGGSAGPAELTALAPALVLRCRQAATARNITPAAFFLALWGILLDRYGEGNRDPYFGVVTSGRPPTPEAEKIVGMCAQVVPLRLPLERLGRGASFISLAAALQSKLYDAADHPRVPPAVLHPLPRHLFAYDNTAEPATGGLEPLDSQGEDGYECVLVFGADGSARFRFDRAAYAPDWMENASRHFAALAEAAAADPDLPSEKLPLTGEEEIRQVLSTFAAGSSLPAGGDVVRRFRDMVRRQPERPAATYGVVTLTYAELDRRSDQLAGALVAAGAIRGRTVGVVLPRSLEAGISFLAVLKAGAVYLPVDPEWPAARIDEILADAGADVVLADDGLAFSHPGRRINPFTEQPEAAPVFPFPGGMDPAYLLYTSGTTGRPKAAVLGHAALANQISWTEQELGLGPEDRVLHYMALTFDPSVWLFASAWALGAWLHITPADLRLDPDAIERYMGEHRITAAVFPARIGGVLLERELPPSLRIICLGGEKPRTVPRQPFRIVNLYGPTEACVNATFCNLAPGKNPGIIGRPVANMRAYVLDESGGPVAVGMPGELCLSGVQLALGYHNRPVETGKAFLTNTFFEPGMDSAEFARLYKTGDITRWLPDGTLQYLGRRDQQIKVRGQRVELGEIETVLGGLAGVREARVVNAGDPDGETRLHAYYLRDADAPQDCGDLARRLAEVLPGHMIPATFTPLEAWPLTPNGKLDVARLPQPNVPTRFRAGEAPATRVEQDVAALWRELLGVQEVGRNDDFFALGGHSLLVFSMLGRLSGRYRAEARDIFECPVLRDFAARLRMVDNEGDGTTIVESVAVPPAYRADVDAAVRADPATKKEYAEILLTGATGFLGSHLVHEYYANTDARLILPVRGADARKRLFECMAFYFGNDWAEAASASGRIRVEPLDLSDADAVAKLRLRGDGTCVVHAAADTAHYGRYELSHAANTAATAALLRLSSDAGAFFGHISTVGAVNAPLVTEHDRDPGPPHQNNYLRTKQLAEGEVFAAMTRGAATAVIRTGNIALNSRTLHASMKYRHNALARLTRLVAMTGMYADTVPPVGYAFVDQTARAVRLLLERPAYNNAVHHLDNPHTVEYGHVFELAGRAAPQIVPTRVLRDRLTELAGAADPVMAEAAREYLGRVRQHVSEVEAGERVVTKVFSSLTVARLAGLGFEWEKLSPRLACAIVDQSMAI